MECFEELIINMDVKTKMYLLIFSFILKKKLDDRIRKKI